MKRLLCLLISFTLLAGMGATSALADGTQSTIESTLVHNSNQDEPENTATALHFEDLRDVLKKYNPSIESMEISLDQMQESNIDGLYTMLRVLEANLGATSSALEDIGTATPPSAAEGETNYSDTFTAIYAALETSLKADTRALSAQIASLEGQILSFDQNMESAKNSTNNGINQIIKGAETLYTAIVNMEVATADLDRALETINRALTLFKTQYELGMVSQFEYESMEYQLRMLQSQRESLDFQISSNKMNLEGMCGMAQNGVVQLSAPALPSQEDMNGVNYDKYLKTATERNVDVSNALIKYDNGRDKADQKAYKAAQETFAAKFKLVCMTIPEKSRLVAVAEDTLAHQERAFELAAKKYELGMISHEEYLTAETEVQTAKSGVYTAEMEEFTAYRNYIWAKDYGIAG